jgi:hypothetical protein
MPECCSLCQACTPVDHIDASLQMLVLVVSATGLASGEGQIIVKVQSQGLYCHCCCACHVPMAVNECLTAKSL